MTKRRPGVVLKTVPGDDFILCTFDLIFGCNVLETDNSIEELCKKIPEHIQVEDNRLSVCRVKRWTINVPGDESDSTPRGLITIFEVEPYEVDQIEEDEDEEEAETTDEPVTKGV